MCIVDRKLWMWGMVTADSLVYNFIVSLAQITGNILFHVELNINVVLGFGVIPSP